MSTWLRSIPIGLLLRGCSLILVCVLYGYVSSTPECVPDVSPVAGCVFATTDDAGRSCCAEVAVRTCVQQEEW